MAKAARKSAATKPAEKEINLAVEASTDNTAVATAKDAPPRFKVVKRVTLPTVNPGVNEPRIFQIQDAFRTSTYVNPDPKKASEKPATVCSVNDLETGEVLLWLVAEVAKKNIEEQYPDESYVGKSFAVCKMPKRPGKRYFDFQIAEVAPE